MKTLYYVVTCLLLALGNVAFAFENPEPQEAEKQSEEVGRQPYMDELPDEVSAMAGLWRIDPDLDRLLGTAENNRHPNSLRLSFAVPGAWTGSQSSRSLQAAMRFPGSGTGRTDVTPPGGIRKGCHSSKDLTCCSRTRRRQGSMRKSAPCSTPSTAARCIATANGIAI